MPAKTKKRRLTEMNFRIASVTYKVTISPGPLIYEGHESAGVTLQSSYEIIINCEVQNCHRLAVLARELTRAWMFELMPGIEREEWLDIAASAARSMFDDLLRYGGEERLMQMKRSKPVVARQSNESGINRAA